MVDIDCTDAVLVIAWGNPLREDDGVAWHVLEGLRSLKLRPGLPALLLYAQQLYGRAPKAVVLSIAGERFAMGESLSPVVRRALPRAIRAVVRQAKAWAPASPEAVRS